MSVGDLLAVLVVVALFTASCGSSDDDAASTSTATTTDDQVASATTDTTGAETETTDTDTTETDPTDMSGGVDVSLFFDGALSEEPTIEDCALSGGAETTCYQITVAGYPVSHEVGPFCPETINDTAEAGGIWFDGNDVHDLSGEFCSELGEASDGETPMFGYAMDGFPIHSPLDEADLAAAELDECNGHTTEANGYHYHANNAAENQVVECLIGQTVADAGGDGPAGGPPPGGG